MATIGFIGLGNMGGPMAANLVAAGHTVRGYDMAQAALDALVAKGGQAAAGIADAVQGAETVITMLPAGRHVRAVLGEVFGLLPEGTLVIDCSTIDVATARDMHEAAEARNLPHLDAPVSGGITGATGGTLTFMVGGAARDVLRAGDLLGVMGRAVVHAGGPGAGQAAKVCNNLILGVSMLGVAEAFALAEKLGLPAQALYDVASKSSGQCWALTSYCPVPGPVPGSPANRDYQPGFAAALMLKDMTLATDAAEATGAEQWLTPRARDAYATLVEDGEGDRDFSYVARRLLEGRPLG
jgi:3-hydroxyisobutyrate dehydrogenase